MPALIKSPEAIATMREAATIVAGALDMIGAHVKPGVTTAELDALCHRFIEAQGGVAACVGYQGYRHATCISVNQVVCHGVPGPRQLKEGDCLNIDLVAQVRGIHADTSAMFFAGKPGIAAARLARITQEALYLGIREVKPGATLGDVGAAIQQHAARHGVSVVRDFCGHGIGTAMHEEPQVAHFGQRGTGRMLVPGMTFTIEPMLNAGGPQVRVMPDGWTVVTRDRSLSAQWEHTVLVAQGGVEVLTLRASERATFGAMAAAG
ncbi:MAG: methionine aminopeptidase [Methylibium sp. NZG]|nr:MAG: methionine aminopeptidase [Methylibium sp. NZG]